MSARSSRRYLSTHPTSEYINPQGFGLGVLGSEPLKMGFLGLQGDLWLGGWGSGSGASVPE